MENSVSIKLLSQDDIFSSGSCDFSFAVSTAAKAISEYAEGKILFPAKISQVFDEQTQDRINCLPATLLEQKVCGVKWISVFPGNPHNFGISNISALIVLSSIETGYPFAVIEGALCSALRTAAVSTVAARYLARSDSSSVGFVGAGEQAKMHFLSLKDEFPGIRTCYIASRTAASEQKFFDDVHKLAPDVEFVRCAGDYEKCVRHADILVSAISGQAPIVRAEWIKKGALYIHVGGWEDEYEVPLAADKIVCDCWEAVKHRTQTISRLYHMGRLADSDIYCDIDKLVSGTLPGRQSEDEFIYFDVVGLSYVDIALAYNIYRRCDEKGLGTEHLLRAGGIFEYLNGCQ